MNQVANRFANQPNVWNWMQSFQPTFHQRNLEKWTVNQSRMQSFQAILLPLNLVGFATIKKSKQVTFNKQEKDAVLLYILCSKHTQLVGSCHDKKSERVGNRASTQLVGSCHDKKSERVGNRASTQLVGSCHDEKSESGLLLRQPVQYEKEIVQSSPAVDAFSQQALHSFQYANVNHKR